MHARVAWGLTGLCAVAVALDTAIVAAYGSLLSEQTWAQHGWPLATAATLGCAVMGALIITRQPRHPVGWLLILCGVPSAVSLALESYSVWVHDHAGPGSDLAGHVAAWGASLVAAPLALTGLTFIFLIAPDGRMPPGRSRLVGWIAVSGLLLFLAAILSVSPSKMTVAGDEDADFGLFAELASVCGILLVGIALIASAVSMVRRLRRAQGQLRQQLRWVAAAAAGLALGFVLLITVQLLSGGDQTWFSALPLYVAYFAFPICIAIAVLRHRMFDLDLIINRALVLALASAAVTIGYVAVVVVVGGNQGGFWPSLLATVVVALAFQPLRTRVVRLADRLAYGKRAAPYEALMEFSRRLGDSPDPATLLPAVADAAAAAAGGQRATVRLSLTHGPPLTATSPAGQPDIEQEPHTAVSVVSGEEELGRLLIEPMPGHPLRPTDLRMLQDLANQTTTAFSNIRLSAELAARVDELSRSTTDLQASRRRLIEARDQECARIERAVSRDVMPHLEPMPPELSRLADASNPRLDESIDAMADAAVAALEALREITHGVFPTQLARAGLRAAVASHLSSSAGGGRVTIDEAAAPLRFGSRLESAAYFCFIEASRSLGPPIEVSIAAPDGHLRLTVSGRHADGLSLVQMSDRVDAVGGSLRTHRVGDRSVIDVDLPVSESHPAASAGLVVR